MAAVTAESALSGDSGDDAESRSRVRTLNCSAVGVSHKAYPGLIALESTRLYDKCCGPILLRTDLHAAPRQPERSIDFLTPMGATDQRLSRLPSDRGAGLG